MSDTVVRAENLGKEYRIGRRQRYRTLRDTVAEAAAAPFRWLRRRRSDDGAANRIWALRDVSFEVRRGEVVGVIGSNGAGKSTLLKVLSQITEPTTGEVELRGRVGSLLEVGTGFHPELTGRENIFLNGAILGMRRTEIARKYDEIVAFAEVEPFIETPVKRYSTGMYMRLAFAVAAHLEPEIFVVDEVLAVGDAAFQKKCLGKMGDVARQGRTVLFVSHNMSAVSRLCRRLIVLKGGGVVADTDDVAAGVQAYLDERGNRAESSWVREEASSDARLVIERAECELRGKQPHQQLALELRVRSLTSHKPVFLAVDCLGPTGDPVWQAVVGPDPFLPFDPEGRTVRCLIELPPLIPSLYQLCLWAGSHYTETYDYVRSCVCFTVLESPTSGRTFPHTADHGCIVPVVRDLSVATMEG